MSTRTLGCITILGLGLGLAACSIAEARPGSDLTKPTLRPKTPPTTEPKPWNGEETGALAGLSAAHNQVRAEVGVAALAWSPTLARYAQEWANQLAANGCQLAHRPNLTYGENLFWTSSAVTSQYVVNFWASEKANYDIATNTCSTGNVCGHYTQIVWATTTNVGCGMATCDSKQIWVCNYDPAGNLYGQKPY